MGADGPLLNREPAANQHDQAVDQRGRETVARVELDLEALDAEVDRFLAAVPVAETGPPS